MISLNEFNPVFGSSQVSNPFRPKIFYDQRVQPDVRHNVMCGATTDATGGSAYGRPETPEDYENWMRENLGGEVSVENGTSVAANQAALRGHGASIIDAEVNMDNAATYQDQGWQIHALFRDNNNADPDGGGPYHHFSDMYDHFAGGWQFANAWGGRDIGYGDAQVRGAIEYLFAFRWPVAGLDDLFAALKEHGVFKDDDDAKNWFCWFNWWLTLRRPYDENHNADWRGILDNEGGFRLAQILSGGAEATARSAQIGHALDQFPSQ